MISRNQLKFIHSLRLKKFRDIDRAFTVEGIKMVDELLASNFRTIEIFGTRNWLSSRSVSIQSRNIPSWEITEAELEKASNLVTPNEVIAVVSIPDAINPEIQSFGKFILILDRIQDPGNLGTILRTADWFGIHYIFASEDTADLYNPKVIQATMGSVFRVSLHYSELSSLIRKTLVNWNIYGASAEGENIHTSEINFPAALIIGNESRGISEDILSLVTKKIGIQSSSGGAESLNASVATGILCSEFLRRMN
jgi:TrmH family RNA methyltransferase